MATEIDDLLAATRAYLAAFSEPVADFVAGHDWEMPARDLAPADIAATRHLDRCAEIATPSGDRLAAMLARSAHRLSWGQTYTAADFGQSFIDNYGWVELFGTRGHFASDAMAGGFLVLGPNIVYPDHHHVAEEIYIPLTSGTAWRKGEGAFVDRPAGEPIHHPSNVSHAMRTDAEPLLALYLWRGGPLAQRSIIDGR